MRIAGLKTADGRWIARRVLLARTFRERLTGLLLVKSLNIDEALLLSPGASIHTFGMPYPIDAVFLNGQMKILRLAIRIAPWRIRIAPAQTRHVLELPAGRANALGLRPNTYICIEHEPVDVVPSCSSANRPARRSVCDMTALRFSLSLPARACTPPQRRERCALERRM